MGVSTEGEAAAFIIVCSVDFFAYDLLRLLVKKSMDTNYEDLYEVLLGGAGELTGLCVAVSSCEDSVVVAGAGWWEGAAPRVTRPLAVK